MRRDPIVASRTTTEPTRTALPISAGGGSSWYGVVDRYTDASTIGANVIAPTIAVRRPVLGSTIVRRNTTKHVHRMFAVSAMCSFGARQAAEAKIAPLDSP